MFPLGIYPYLIGGILIGVAVSYIYIATGLHATQSSFFSTTLSWFSNQPYFRAIAKSRKWRLVFAAAVFLGAFIYTFAFSPDGFYTTSIELWRILLGGFLVGFGTRLSQGCTSGHGISGIASLSTTSLVAVITFLGVGIITASTLEILWGII